LSAGRVKNKLDQMCFESSVEPQPPAETAAVYC